MDEFNEFLFDFTSKIPVDEIEKAKNGVNNKKDVISPYTNVKKDRSTLKIFIIIISIVVLIVLGYLVLSNIKNDDFKDDNITYAIRR